MEDVKYQVFVSSTYVDLIDARKKVIETVLSLYHFPVGMEMFSADDDEQWEIIKETIDVSDYYIVIIGHKYGSVAASGISYTEMEYDYAKSLGIPVLAFIRNRNVSTQPYERESIPENIDKLSRFIEKAQASKMCDFWDSIDDLATKVAIAFPKIIRRKPRVGWVRGDKATPQEVSNELAELSNENRKLREKVREYESELHFDAPVLKLAMIDEDLILDVASNHKKQDYIKPMSRSDIPINLNQYISNEDIASYNESIPSNEKVDAYNNRLFFYQSYMHHSVRLSPVLENVGRKVASDIYVEIEYPDFLVAVTDRNKTFFTELPVLKFPETPVELVERKLKARDSIDKIRHALVTNSFPAPLGLNNNVLTGGRTLPLIQPVDPKHWIVYEKNLITLRAKKLLQSLTIKFDDVTLVPIKKGEGLINFKIVCEELKEPIIFSRHVRVTA